MLRFLFEILLTLCCLTRLAVGGVDIDRPSLVSKLLVFALEPGGLSWPRVFAFRDTHNGLAETLAVSLDLKDTHGVGCWWAI